MMERIEGMLPGTVGLRASGKLSKADYTEMLEPVLNDAVTSGELRLAAWKRFALVTDVEWVAKSMRLFAWLTPGEVLVCDLGGLEQAKRWVAT